MAAPRHRVLLTLAIPLLVVVMLVAAWAIDTSQASGKVPAPAFGAHSTTRFGNHPMSKYIYRGGMASLRSTPRLIGNDGKWNSNWNCNRCHQ